MDARRADHRAARRHPSVVVPTAPVVGAVLPMASAPFGSPVEALDSIDLMSARGAAVQVLESWELA